MAEPTITCPSCRSEIKLNESLAAPLIADATRRFEETLASQNEEIARREAAVRLGHAALARARDADFALRARLEGAVVTFAKTLSPDARARLAEGLSRGGPLRHPAPRGAAAR